MLTRKCSALLAYAATAGILVAAGITPVISQQRESLRPDLSGRWQLNRERSENAEAKLERAQTSQAGGHGPGRHLGGLFGGGLVAQMKQARDLFLYRPSWFALTQGRRAHRTDR